MGDEVKTAVDRPHGRPDDDAKADALTRRYVPGNELGHGGMGRVVEATDTLLGRTVAIKQALDADDLALGRFKREMMITARLEHPSIVPVYDAGRADDGSPFYVMRKVSGEPLADLISDADTLDRRLGLLPHLLAATQAVAHAHQRGVIHRDLKPTNVLVGSLGETIVIDWGLAKVIDEPEFIDPNASPSVRDTGGDLQTRVGAVIGTPGFMPPEQLRSSDVDARADVYALGATLYYLLTRKPPHAGSTAEDMMAKALKGPPAPASSLVEGIPAELSTICDKALAYEDDKRYPHAGALAEDLDRFLKGQLVASHDYSTVERIARFVKRNRVPVAVVAIALVALAAGAWVAVGRVIAARNDALAARDEAISARGAAEAARQREADRANDLTLAQARLLLDSNPTASVALLRPLADSARWREARALAADARSAGVAWRLPSPHSVISIDIFPDGFHAAAISSEGELWSYDLLARTGRFVADLGAAFTIKAIDDTDVIAYDPHAPQIYVIDLVTGARRHIAGTAAVRRIVAHAGITYWSDAEGHAWQLAVGSSTPEPIIVADQIRVIEVSPDGTQLALGGDAHLWLRTAGKLESIANGHVRALAWEDQRIAGIIEHGMFELDLAPKRELRLIDIDDQIWITLVHGVRYSSSIGSVIVGDVRPQAWPRGNYLFGLYRCGPDHVVTARQDGTLSVIEHEHRQEIPSPTGSIGVLAASPQSHFVLTVNRGLLLLWNLDQILPVMLPPQKQDDFVSIGSVGPHLVSVAHDETPATWIDLASHQRTEGPILPVPLKTADSPSGASLFVASLDGAGSLVHPGTKQSVSLGTGYDLGWFVDDNHLAVAMKSGDIRLHDLASGKVTTLLAKASKVSSLRGPPNGGHWLVAGYSDGTLWRYDVRSGHSTTLQSKTQTWQRAEAVITSNGDVWTIERGMLRQWRTDGTTVGRASLPETVIGLADLDDRHLLGFTNAADSYLIDLAKPEAFETSIALGALDFDVSTAASLLTVSPAGGGVIVFDAVVNQAFRVARSLGGTPTPHISGDGNFLFAFTDNTFEIWSLDLPQSQGQTAAWISAMTNGVARADGALTWP